ncbi:MAG: hypothetical protein ABL900_08115 [Burkholderiaceae bacterium]
MTELSEYWLPRQEYIIFDRAVFLGTVLCSVIATKRPMVSDSSWPSRARHEARLHGGASK